MNKISSALLVGTAMLALAGCQSNGDGSGSSADISGTGAYLKSNSSNEVTDSGSATASFTTNGDETTVKITGGDLDGETITFNEDGEADLGTGTAYLTALGDSDEPDNGLSAFVQVDNDDGSTSMLAFRSSDNLTDDMPTTGTATYTGTIHGGSVVGGELSDMTGTASLDVDFGANTVAGTFDIDDNPDDLTFDATISGSTYTADSGDIALGSVDLADSSYVEGAFYGDNAEGTAGTYLLVGEGANEGDGAVGAFQATK